MTTIPASPLAEEPPDRAYVVFFTDNVWVRDDKAASEAGYSTDGHWFDIAHLDNSPQTWAQVLAEYAPDQPTRLYRSDDPALPAIGSDRMSAAPQPREPYEYQPCDGCTCCSQAGCHRGPGSDCAVGGEGTYFEGEYICPCTGG